MPRMQILTPLEQKAFDAPPEFNSEERIKYFDVPAGLLHLAQQLRTPTNQVCFLVSCGYFMATKKFYAGTFHPPDLDYVAHQLGLSAEDIHPAVYDKQTLRRHQEQILDFYGFKPFDGSARTFITREIEAMVRTQQRPQLIFLRGVDILIREKVEVPGYFLLADLILQAINAHKDQLAHFIEKELTPPTRAVLDELLVQVPATPDGAPPSKTAAYKLTLLKKLSQSTRPAKIKERVADLYRLQELHGQLQPLLMALNLAPDGIRYYAESVIKAEIFQLTRRAEEDRYLHLTAFVAHQYYRLQDNLVDVLLQSVQTYINTAQREHKEHCYERRAQRSQSLKTLVGYLDEDLLGTLTSIQAITETGDLTAEEKLAHIRALLQAQEPTRRTIETCLEPLKQELESELAEETYYRMLEARSVRLQNRVSPIVKALTFQGEAASAALMEAIAHFKAKDGQVAKGAPTDFLKPAERHAVLDPDETLNVSLYKVLLFLHIASAIKSGTLNLEYAYKYRPLDQYLIDRTRWQEERTDLLQRAGLQEFADPQPILDELDQVLHAQYATTNQPIREGQNTLVAFAKDGTFRLTTPKREESVTDGLPGLFPERHYVSLLEVLATMNRHSGFLDAFQHWQPRYNRPKPPPPIFLAGITGLGCGIGIRKLARISRQLSETELEHTVNWYFSPENLQAANDQILYLLDRMELPNVYRRTPEQLHTASDGQKFDVDVDSLNARYSFKYLGQRKGVSVYSFIDERHLLFFSTVISAVERESAYVIDGLMHNDVVKSDIHSTDTHGYSEAIFATMHLLGFSYAPRIKNLKKQRLYTFRSRQGIGAEADAQIRPSGYIDRALIEAHWDEILRFIATIRLKEATASDLFRRLNSYSQQHGLYRALKAFGQIIKSIFILRYIDDVELRQAIEKQLNKIESVHKFTRAVSVSQPRTFSQAEKHEQEIAEGCKRLIKNAALIVVPSTGESFRGGKPGFLSLADVD